jgi:hypothetical protein
MFLRDVIKTRSRRKTAPRRLVIRWMVGGDGDELDVACG